MPPHPCCMLCVSGMYTQDLVMHICAWPIPPCCQGGEGLSQGGGGGGGNCESYTELNTLSVCTLRQRLQADWFTRTRPALQASKPSTSQLHSAWCGIAYIISNTYTPTSCVAPSVNQGCQTPRQCFTGKPDCPADGPQLSHSLFHSASCYDQL